MWKLFPPGKESSPDCKFLQNRTRTTLSDVFGDLDFPLSLAGGTCFWVCVSPRGNSLPRREIFKLLPLEGDVFPHTLLPRGLQCWESVPPGGTCLQMSFLPLG